MVIQIEHLVFEITQHKNNFIYYNRYVIVTHLYCDSVMLSSVKTGSNNLHIERYK